MTWLVRCVVFLSAVLLSLGQQPRVAPGVPPQQYTQPGQQQHVPMQQVPVQQMQVPVQQVPMQQQQVPMQQAHMQQVPMQQVPVQQVPMQQVPMQQAHVPQVPVQQMQVPVQQVPMQQVPVQQVPVHHGAHHQGHGQQILNAANIAQERDHIQEHLKVPVDTSKMSEQELQFHYFKLHDADNNNKLDGSELIKSLIHWHDVEEEEVISSSDAQFEELIDPILKAADLDNDGFIDYAEYKKHGEQTLGG